MAGVWKRDGTVAVTNGSKKVTGTGTTFADAKNGVAKGHLFCMTTGTTVDLYEVDYVVSNTELHLVQAFRGTTGTGKAYEIITTFSDSIPEFARKLNASLSYYQSQSDMVQQLFTSDAAEITVTAPDGTTHKLIPWKRVTSEGEGQAARAKTEADRSKTEADRSGTEADRAAGIVAAAALPLPDVWAPLSDSLRLITGYGRDVLVGSDVVARMVNFSRSTTKAYQGKDGLQKTVAINEAAFGSGGCLVDGQSTNLVPWPSGYNGETPAWYATNYSMSKRPDGVLITPAAGVAEKCVKLGDNLFPDLPDRPLSMTVEVKGNGCDMVVLGFKSTYISSTDNGIGVSLVDGTVKQTNHGLKVTRFEPLPDGFVRITVSTPSYTTTTIQWRSAVVGCGSMSAPYKAYSAHDADGVNGVIVRNIQLEALPFASSYIPTAGAAATRAADAIQIPYAGNGVPLSDMQMTMSAVIKTNARPGEPTALIDALDSAPNVGVFLSLDGRIHTRIFDVGWITGITPDLTKEQVVALSFNGATGAVAMRVGDEVATGTVVVPKGVSRSAGNIGLLCRSGTNTRTGFGSVRDFKIWHKFFTVDQLKAIK
ncbi:hypothetical protein ACET93_01610 [Aeromonas veronii]